MKNEEPSIKHWRAAILAADIAGYSRLMDQDESITVRKLKGRRGVILPLIARHGGRIVDTAGDGILTVFRSVVGAVQCALAHFQAGRHGEAAAAAQRAIQQRPRRPTLFMMTAASYGLAGATDKAKGAAAQLSNLVPNISAAAVGENFLHCQPEDLSRLATGLRAAGLQG